jgi:hypothetical protein
MVETINVPSLRDSEFETPYVVSNRSEFKFYSFQLRLCFLT